MAYDCSDFVADVSNLLCKDCTRHTDVCDNEHTGLAALFVCISDMRQNLDGAKHDDPREH